MKIRELKDKRARLIVQARSLVDAADKENRDLTTEEQSQYDGLMDEVTGLGKRIDREERLSGMETHLDGYTEQDRRRQDPDEEGRSKDPKTELRQAAWQKYLQFRELETNERRALQADLDSSGGYMVPPEEFVNRLIKKVDDVTYMLQLGDVMYLTSSDSLGIPTLETDPADADWTSEIGTGNEDSDMDFGKRALAPKPLGKRIKVSRKLLRLTPAVEDLVIQRLSYKFGITAEKAGMTGSGAVGPLGVFTASDHGISTSRDVSTGNSTTAPTFDGLIEAKYTLKANYWPRARWIFHRDCVKILAKIKDGEGQYIWKGSLREGEPDRLLSFPLLMSEYAPNTFSASQYVGALGDFKLYQWAIALDMEVQRLGELYAETNRVGFIGRMEMDGMPVLEEAFVRVQLAAG